MTGDAAKENMAEFDFVWIWNAVENGYPVTVKDPVYVWDGTKSSVYAGGNGTATDPYLIDSAAQLAYVVSTNLDDGLYFELIKDIRINDTTKANWKETAKNWVWADVRFVGNFNGNGHTVDGLFTKGDQKRFGLFSYVGDSVFENFILTNASVTTSTSEEGTGIFSSQASAKADYRGIYIAASCEVSAPNSKGVGAIVARSNQNINISDCAVLATLSGKSHVGAFYGTHWGGNQTLNNCFTTSNVPVMTSRTLSNSANNYALVGDTYGTTVLTAEQLTGDAAKTNLAGFDFDLVWQTVENGYPVLRSNALLAWNGTAASAFAGGSGTAADPYLIQDGGQLYKMVADYSNADTSTKPTTQTYFKLTKDINLGGKQWYVTGVTSYMNHSTAYSNIGFNGIVYGEGHTIYGLYSNKSSAAVGLIPVATQGAEIHNLHLENANLPKAAWNTYTVGAFVGLAKGTSGSKPIVFDGCSVKNFTGASRDASSAFVGYAYSQSITIEDCYCVNSDLSHTATSSSNSAAFIGYTDGNDYDNAIIIKNSHSADAYPLPYLSENFQAITTFENVYTCNETYDGSFDGLIKLTASEMQGVAARDNLAGFNFNQIWQYGADGEYPVHKTGDSKELVWDGTTAANDAGGEGTAEKPYKVSTPEQLNKLANATTEETLGKYFVLTNDIEISGVHDGWEKENPYSWTKKTAYLDGFTYGNSFAGTLDGDGYTVSGLYITDTVTNGGNYAYGLIPFVSANAIIKNITVKDVYTDVEGSDYVGAVAGAAHVTEEDAAKSLNAVMFIGVNAINCNGNAILGGASRGVKFELCNAENIFAGEAEMISIRNCNSEDLSYNEDIVIYNGLNADATTLVNVKKTLWDPNNAYITSIDFNADFDIRDLISAKNHLIATDADETLVWSQEFDGSELDYSVWTRNTTMSVGSTLKYADNSTVSDGNLTLSCAKTEDNAYSVNYGLSTIETMSFKYGRLEMCAKVPFGAGAFPSLWLTSRDAIGYDANSEYSTEIDIFEVFGKTAVNNRLVTCIHKWYNSNGVKTGDECSCGTGFLNGNGYKVEETDRSYTITGDAQNDFHTFVFEWDENTMKFSVDGNTYYTAKRSDMENFDLSGYDTDISGIFDQFLCIRLNNHMYTTGDGAAYTYEGSADDIDASNLNYEIDYIRLYQKNDGKSAINLK